ncbi:MAG: topoisomerase, partial [Betaproteobacteria bacterium]|nr:topoisomerase [Betaproteobacteria bacterium]
MPERMSPSCRPPPFLDFNDATDSVTSPHYDRDELRTRLLDRLESVLAYLFPHGKRRGTQFVVGNLQGDPGDSLVIELEGTKRGIWIDFATGESGDVFALWAAAKRFNLPTGFSDLLDDVGEWLMAPCLVVATSAKPGILYDDLGAYSAKWDYLDTDGQLLACVYRYDTPNGKQYRPWDARARAMRMPLPRPLYNQPAIATVDSVVLVEGEKCADALMRVGIVATTAMGGAATAIDKTNWAPLAGKTVAVWPDHDDAGAKYADAVIPKLQSIGARVRRVTVPQGKPRKWVAADAVAEGF